MRILKDSFLTDSEKNPIGQEIMNQSNRTLKEILTEQRRDVESPKDRLI